MRNSRELEEALSNAGSLQSESTVESLEDGDVRLSQVFSCCRMGSLAVECVLFLENECRKESESVIAIVVVQVLQGLLCSQSQE